MKILFLILAGVFSHACDKEKPAALLTFSSIAPTGTDGMDEDILVQHTMLVTVRASDSMVGKWLGS